MSLAAPATYRDLAPMNGEFDNRPGLMDAERQPDCLDGAIGLTLTARAERMPYKHRKWPRRG